VEILPDTYLVITATDILQGDISTSKYNNIEIWHRIKVIHFFNTARLFFYKEFNVNVTEFHLIQAKNASKEPIPDPNGHYSWLRIKTKDNQLSDWIVTDFYPSKTYCAASAAFDTGNLTQANSAFRFGLVQSLSNNNYSITDLV